MDCKQWRDMASEYLEGSLPTGAHEAMRLHVSTCAACRRDEVGLRTLCRELNVLPSVDPPLFFADNVRSAIERQRNAKNANAPWWRTVFFGDNTGSRAPVFGQMGRVAVGTLLTGGAVAAIGWTLLLTGSQPHSDNRAAIVPPVPGFSLNASPAAALPNDGEPILRVAQVTTMLPGTGPAYDLSFWLENADHGVARSQLVGDPRSYSFVLRHGVQQMVRVPYSGAQGNSAIALSIHWTSGGASHNRYIVLPGAAGPNGATAEAGHAEMPAERQSFGLAEESVLEAARETSARYGIPITLDDVPDSIKIRVTAQDESAADALRRSLAGSPLRISADSTGIQITAPTSASATPASDSESSGKASAE